MCDTHTNTIITIECKVKILGRLRETQCLDSNLYKRLNKNKKMIFLKGKRITGLIRYSNQFYCGEISKNRVTLSFFFLLVFKALTFRLFLFSISSLLGQNKITMPVQFPKHLKPIEPQGTALLQQERNNATFKTNDLTRFIYGNDYLKRRDSILQILQADPILGDKSHRYYNGRDVRFKKSLAAANRLVELTR